MRGDARQRGRSKMRGGARIRGGARQRGCARQAREVKGVRYRVHAEWCRVWGCRRV